MTQTHIKPLPVTLDECKQRGWDEVDIVLVTGDGYVDHPSFGISLIGRLLEGGGYRVAFLPSLDSTMRMTSSDSESHGCFMESLQVISTLLLPTTQVTAKSVNSMHFPQRATPGEHHTRQKKTVGGRIVPF